SAGGAEARSDMAGQKAAKAEKPEKADTGEKQPKRRSETAPAPRLRERDRHESLPALQAEPDRPNPTRAPRLHEIVVNMGVGDAIKDNKLLDAAVADLMAIVGQKPVITRARKSIAAFKLREGMAIGVKVTLRGARMWEFLDRMLSTAFPRIR